MVNGTGVARAGVMLALALLSFSGASAIAQRADALPPPVVLSSGWLMQDANRTPQPPDIISFPGFMPGIYQPVPYVPPDTASANPAASPGSNGAARPRNSSEWAQAPGPTATGWYRATVPGTVLTTLVDNQVYPEPLYGENNRPNIIPESLARASYWYRTVVAVPSTY